MKFSTKAIHVGNSPEKSTGSVANPIYLTSTYAKSKLSDHGEFEYGRTQNPNRFSLEENIASLENGKFATVFSSGVAAIQSLLALLNNGDNIIAPLNIYGGTFRLFEKVFSKSGISISWIDFEDTDEIEKSITNNSKMIFIETPSNPLLSLTDLSAIVKLAKANNLITAADNTFMTPFNQRPLEFGVDIVIHSSSKFITGHSDLIGGMVVTNSSEIDEKIKFWQNAVGAIPSPFDCWLTLRSIKTLPVRMQAHNKNALKAAEFIENKYPQLNTLYPGLKSSKNYQLASEQMDGYGAVVTIDFLTEDLLNRFIEKSEIFTLAESLGGIESMINHSWTMSHSSMSTDLKRKMGITKTMARLSIGLEDIEDIIADIDFALS